MNGNLRSGNHATPYKLKSLKYESNLIEVNELFALPTGSWRYQRPAIKVAKCCQCGWCYLFCPTGSMVEKDNHFAPDLDFCKGCGICASVCPNDAVLMIREN